MRDPRSETRRKNEGYVKKRALLIQQFGGRCQFCGWSQKEQAASFTKEGDEKKELQFAHKIGFRFSEGGGSRGRNYRVAQVYRNPERFFLLCNICHREYDRDNPQTPEEKSQDIPF